ncbi:MobF family relaxase [Amycolatopsis anabasis]|uniref:MobF family relaxase n=1 Tax=Amycolatopsis anabasis TaxID=1840409 RepID=UPI00131BCAD2|nr:MobF family relaxase [Amycolatopsis anabasis]
MGFRTLSPGGHEYLTRSVACGDAQLEPGELLSDYFLSHGYPAGQWFGVGADELGVTGEVTAAQMNALFGEGRHPDADEIEADMIADGASAAEAEQATRLGRRFPRYGGTDHLRSEVIAAFKKHNRDNGRRPGAPIDEDTRAEIRRLVQVKAFKEDTGKDPVDGNDLKRWLAQKQKPLRNAVAGFEVVFEPPKSVSVAFALADKQGRDLIVSLHRQAVRDALSYLEANTAFTRKGNHGEAQVDIVGIAATLWEHWDARSGDPHLHTHVPISTKVKRAEDGKWTSLDGRTMHAAAVTVSEYYDSRLRDLFRDHGARWVQRGAGGIDMTRPVWELAAIPVVLIRAFSKRSQQVEEARARRIVKFRAHHQREPTPKELFEIKRQAQYDNRPGKKLPKTLDEHTAMWRQFAAKHVNPKVLDTLSARIFRGRPEKLAKVPVAGLAEQTRYTVSDNYSHFTRWNVEAEAHRQSAGYCVAPGQRDAVITEITDAVLNAEDTLPLRGPSLVSEPDSLRRRDGESVFIEHNSTRYTTTQTLREEANLVAWARRTGGHRLRQGTVDAALKGARLNAGQRRLVTGFARSGRRVQLALAPAGAGKTTAMRVFAKAWRRTGGEVYAFGPSARAAHELGKSIKAKPHTLHQVTTALRFGFAHRAFPFAPGDVLIIDEAAMAGTHTLYRVVRYALKRGADVRLVGDDRQLASVEAGGVVRLIAHDVGAIRFREVVRFKGPDAAKQAKASLRVRDGDTRGLDYYLDNDLVLDGSRETMRDAARAAWRADLDAGEESLLIVPTNEDTVWLNLEARALRLERGDIAGGREVALHDGTMASAGDWVVTRENERLLSLMSGRDFVKNGDTWTVVKVHPSGKVTVQHREHGGKVVLPARYVAANVELAYASTVKRVQGMTSRGNAHTLVPPNMTLEQFYPGITRAMWNNFLYVITHHHVADAHQETPLPQTARAVLTGVLHHSGAEVSATETLRDNQHREESMATLILRYNYTARYDDEAHYPAVVSRHAPAAVGTEAEPALVQTLRNAHDFGWDAEHLLRRAANRGPLDRADDPAALLQARITKHITGREPPPRTAQPRPADVKRWRVIVDNIVPTAAVEDPVWELVWRHAAGALPAGLDADNALTRAAGELAVRPGHDPMSDHEFTRDALVNHLAQQWEAGQGHQRAVPWQARPDLCRVDTYPGHRKYLVETNAAIKDRVEELRAAAIRDQPRWAARLGPRPPDPVSAEQWDELVGLAAAYRETYGITGTDPDKPLGEQPEGQGLRARAWQDLATRWGTHTATPATDDDTSEVTDEVEFLDTEARYVTEPLNVLVPRHDQLARQGDADRYLDIVAHYLLEAVNAPAEMALLNALGEAQDRGWQAEHLVARLTENTRMGNADDPAALLAARITRHIHRHDPPPRTAEPRAQDVRVWRRIVLNHAPAATPKAPQWGLVWRRAAGALATGHDPVPALARAADQLAARIEQDPMDDAAYVANALAAELRAEHDRGAGYHRALPWLTQPAFGALDLTQGRLDNLAALNAEIATRIDVLRDHVIRDQPRWASGLGPRPDDPAAARRWDTVIGLAAAYRETYGVHATDPALPLGFEPLGNNAKTHAWRDLTAQWAAISGQADDASRAQEAVADAVDEVFDDAFVFDTEDDRYVQDRMDKLVRWHDQVARDGDEDRFLDILARHLPEAINAPAEQALTATLSRAQDQGWQAERLVPRVLGQANLAGARDPAAVLTSWINTHIRTHEAPARTADPHPDDIQRWRAIVTERASEAGVHDREWQLVWRHAAGGQVLGVDVDAALAHAAERLAAQPPDDAFDDFRVTAQALVAELTRRYDDGEGHHPAVPWLATADFGAPGDHASRITAVAEINAQILERMQTLREAVAREQPSWAAGLGPRPADPVTAGRWDHVVSLAAAYRETYGITSTNASSPVGRKPGSGVRAEAWQYITKQWRPLMTRPDRETAQSQADLEVTARRTAAEDQQEDLRDDAIEGLLDSQDDATDARRAAGETEGADFFDDVVDEAEGSGMHLGY